MPDSFTNYASGLDSPAMNAAAITPSDSVAMEMTSRGIYVGVGGNISVLTAGGDTVVFVGVFPGTIIPIRVNRVNATGTTASSLLSLY
jgi:predicted S18 family serine protease